MSFTPRRSTRGAVFTPSPFPSPSLAGPSTDTSTSYHWLSPATYPSGSTEPHYTSLKRVTDLTTTPGRRKGKGKAKAGDGETTFNVGDGAMVTVEGSSEGVGIITRMWEEEVKKEKDDDESDEEMPDEEEEGDEKEMIKMAEIHWCFRRFELPSIMKNLTVEDNEVLLAASPVRPVTTPLPVTLLMKPVPIYSRADFKTRYEPVKSSVRGWTYIRTGVYWCERAFDKGAKGGQAWRVDVKEWRERGKRGDGWAVTTVGLPEPVVEPESDDEASGSEAEVAPGEEEEEDEEGEAGAEGAPKKRKRATKAKAPSRPAKKRKSTTMPAARTPKKTKSKRMPHPQASTTHIPSSVPNLDDLPVDPYQRALRLLHVGATPESLPCREEEFVEVLSKVEEGVEGGGGGCLYIAGVPGTGKTATVHAVVKELKRKAEDGELPPFSYVEINGLKIPSPQHAYTVLWEAISGAQGTSSKTALRGLEAHFNRKTGGVRGPRGHTFVVLMDELDQLLTTKQDVVYNFFNWPTMRDSQLFVIAVANRMDLPQQLAAKIKSRLGLQTLLFQPYDRQNLIEIVQSRLIAHPKSKAEHKVLQPDAIALAATKMAGTNGDARRVLDACRRAVEVILEKNDIPHPVTAKEMMGVLNQMSSSPVALFVKSCSEQQKMMLAAMVRCVRREGVPEIQWRAVRSDHDNLTRSLLETTEILSPSELLLVFSSLIASHAMTAAADTKVGLDDRRVALGMEIGEVGRVLMGEGEGWRRALAGV